ncbi:MAG TPA: hypothetical protein VK171_02125 [Fimbriimonas sp.]|nr:hypothetical protein [Fimbriimonas sp.]
MKLKHIFVTSLIALCSCLAVARDVGTSFLWSSGTNSTAPAVTKDEGKLTNVFGRRGFDLDILSLVSKTPANAPVIGGAVVGRLKLADQASLTIGPALTAAQGVKPSLGVLLGVSLRF